MKKLILSLLLLIPSISHADTATTGNPKLILVSTGSVDRTRSWGDKVNENFSIISASMATLIAGGTGGSGGPQSSLAGSIATGPLNMNQYAITNATNVALLEKNQTFIGSNTFLNSLVISTGNLTFAPPYPVVGIGTGFYGNPSSVRTMLEARANYTGGFAEIALRNPSTTDGTGVAYRLSNDDINAGVARLGLTASLNSVYPTVAFLAHPTNGLYLGRAVPTAGHHPTFITSYINQSNVSMVGIGTSAPQGLLHVVSTPGMTVPLVIFSSPSLVPSAGRMVEVNRSSVVFGVPIYGDGSNLSGIVSGGSSGPSTFTITMQSGQGGGLYLSTTVFGAIDSYVVIKDTVEITSIQAFTLGDVSTMTALISINRSTEPYTSINVVGIHTSSITIRENTRVNTLFKPDTINVFYPNDRLYMYCPIPVTSGTVPSGVAVKMRGFRWP